MELFISEEFGVFLIEDYHLDAITLEFGARADWVARDPDTAAVDSRNYSNLSFSASVLWDIDSQWNIGLALSHSERAPTTQELYSNAEAQDPSQLNGVWLEATFFYSHFDDYIGLFNTGLEADETAIYAYEQDDAVFQGFEFEAEFELGQLGPGQLILEIFGDTISASFDNNGKVPRLPPSRLVASAVGRGPGRARTL